MKVLIACEFSARVRDAFLARGHDAWSCDLVDSDGDRSRHLVCDVRDVLGEAWDLIVAFPPCTDLAVSGARWWSAKRADGRQRAAVDLFMTIADAPPGRIAIENPVGFMSVAWRKPDQIVQPWQFGHGETKQTCLWLKGLPKLRPTDIVEGRYPATWRAPDSRGRARRRSLTYTGIAQAMAEQWGES